MSVLRGIAISDGRSVGVVQIAKSVNSLAREAQSVACEIERYQLAVEAVTVELASLRDMTEDSEQHDIMETHLMLLDDPGLSEPIQQLINDGISAYDAVKQTVESIAQDFEQLNDEYLRARAVDIRDIGHRLSREITEDEVEVITPGCIYVTEELYPSQVASLSAAAGAVSQKGGSSSHAAILIRAAGIPAVFGVNGILSQVTNGQQISIDGYTGTIDTEPSDQSLNASVEDPNDIQNQLRTVLAELGANALNIKANIGSVSDAHEAMDAGCDGFGIVRTEFLFQDRATAPTEQEQYDTYALIVKSANGKPVVLRTLDAGADKPLAYIDHAQEANPALGLRGLRLCLAERELFRTQLRAMLRAAQHGPITVLFPMVTTTEELSEAISILQHVKHEVGADHNEMHPVKVGVMIETPSSALIAPELAKMVDYLSVGTNDLTQYTLAVDRTNGPMGYLYDETHPAVLRLIQMAADAANEAGIPICICGEMANRYTALMELLKIGIREISVSAVFIPRLRKLLPTKP